MLAPALGVYSLLAVGAAVAGASQARIHRLYRAFAGLVVRVVGMRCSVVGREHVEKGDGSDPTAPPAFVVVCNHESMLDPFPLLSALPELMIRFVVKQEIMRIPIFGHALAATGNVRVVRQHRETAGDVERLRAGMSERDPGVSLLFFAEGTRSRDGALQAFKTGPFATALRHGVPVLPVALAGTFHVLPKGTLRARAGPVVLAVGEPIPTTGRRFEERGALRDEAHAAVAALREQARARLAEAAGRAG